MKPKKTKDTKEKKFNVRLCPKCKSDEVVVAIGQKIGTWECKKCGFKGTAFEVKEMNEDEYFEYLDNKGMDLPELGEPETVEEIGAKKSYKEILKERVARGEKI